MALRVNEPERATIEKVCAGRTLDPRWVPSGEI
jgi:hypothetical protein